MAKNYIGVINHYNAAPDSIRSYFPDFVDLVEQRKWEIAISYVFIRLEQVKRIVLYCGIVKLHWCEADMTWSIVSSDHLSRQRFFELFEIVFDKDIPKDLKEKLRKGEQIRDKISHGMDWRTAEAREGLISIIDFASAFEELVYELGEFRPFGDLRGFKGRKEPLTTSTTHWVLKGMGILK